ncbi:MAG: 16S rRNA (cytosine(1402)-N(4))-methyltransferase RsmH [Desulfobacteraceae bacterium]|jgi:16S rRNA (cytosine1402-N4)-methyltransferase|nr:16S rRNA (cytosine(1402)-N(4))-methyltransferase RsmH [Desulfobacteraceae bacterium]
MIYRHIPVMLSEIIEYLNCRPGKCYVDCTVGGAGHSSAILERIKPDGMLVGIDQDADAIQNAVQVFKPDISNVRLIHDNYVNLPNILSQLNICSVDGIVADLGLSFNQLENSGRGFSFLKTEPLDMRMDASCGITAADIVNNETEESLERIFKSYGEERWARKIARRIVALRAVQRIQTSSGLAEIVCDAIPKRSMYKRKKHPATKVFMALRIAVNNELEVLESFIASAVDYLTPGGRICFLSFHSLEDRIVKRQFKKLEGKCTCPPDFPKCVCDKKQIVKILTRKVIRPTEEEVNANSMARSACLRVAEKVEPSVV